MIFGTGSIACETAKRFSAFDCKVFGVNTSGNKVQYFDDVFKNDDFESVLKNSDIIVSTLPLSEDTKHFFNKDFFDPFFKKLCIACPLIGHGREDFFATFCSDKTMPCIAFS